MGAAVEAIRDLEFEQTANLAVEAWHDLWTPAADTEPISELEFDQALAW